MLIIGLLCMAVPTAAGGFLCWENRNTLVQVRIGGEVWSGHLFGVFVLGVLFACWFLLGVSIVRLYRRERAERAAERRSDAPTVGAASGEQPEGVAPKHALATSPHPTKS